MSAKALCALRLPSILLNFAIGRRFVFAYPVCLLVFKSFSCIVQSTLGHVSTNGCRKGWQCSLLISNVVAGIFLSLFLSFSSPCLPSPIRVTPILKRTWGTFFSRHLGDRNLTPASSPHLTMRAFTREGSRPS